MRDCFYIFFTPPLESGRGMLSCLVLKELRDWGMKPRDEGLFNFLLGNWVVSFVLATDFEVLTILDLLKTEMPINTQVDLNMKLFIH